MILENPLELLLENVGQTVQQNALNIILNKFGKWIKTVAYMHAARIRIVVPVGLVRDGLTPLPYI
jgi:hypothetical protein